jgi:hypothetical protein
MPRPGRRVEPPPAEITRVICPLAFTRQTPFTKVMPRPPMQPPRRFLLPAIFAASFALGSAQISLIQTGGTFRSDDTNLATSGTAFSSGEIGVAPHSTANLNNGTYGNSSSWIGDGASSAGILLGSAANLSSFAFGRDNTGAYTDRNAGTYNFYYTTDTGLDPGSALSASWTSLGSLTYSGSSPVLPASRHLYNLSSTVSNATGFRIDSAAGTAIDEIELYSTAAGTPSSHGVSNLTGTSLGNSYKAAGKFIAQSFTTSASANPFRLSSVSLPISSGYGINDFTVRIQEDLSGLPGAVVGTLTGTSSPTTGQFDFVSGSLNLDASTTYWITWGFTSGSGQFGSPQMAGTAGTGDWTFGNSTASSDAGASWFGPNPGYSYQISIQAMSAVPEPSTYAALLGALALGLAIWRRRKTQK